MGLKEKLARRRFLDRRRLEESFLLYAVLRVHFLYDLGLDHVDYDKNLLLEKVVNVYLGKFQDKWGSKFVSVIIGCCCGFH